MGRARQLTRERLDPLQTPAYTTPASNAVGTTG